MQRNPTVLVVDDEPLNVELLKSILEPLQFDVRTAVNGAEALDSLARDPSDIVLLDVMMPVINGFEVCRRIRADRTLKGIPVILLTALHETTDRIMGIDAGCDEFVTKPFDKNEVVARIRTLLRLNFYRSQIDEKEKFENVMHRMNDGLVVCGPGMGIKRANQRARELLGTDDNSPLWLARLARDFRVGYYGDLRRDLGSQDLEFDVERPETGSARPLILSFSSSLMKDPDGGVSSVVIILHDVTEQRQERLRKESFLNLLSDKLRAPLAKGLKDLAALPDPPPAVDEVMDFLRKMEKIFDFLSVSGSDRLSGLRPPVDMAGLRSLFNAAVDAQPGKAVECEYRLEAGLGLSMAKDALGILLKNLVENASKFTDQTVAKVTLSASREGDKARVTVADNGHGLPGEERQAIFDAFYQVDRRGAGKAPGLGLGLAIVKRIVQSNQGEIRAELPPGGGTSVTFTLPLALA
jgi:two-component system cell cycle response regulator